MDAIKSKLAFLKDTIKPLVRKKNISITHKYNHKDKKKQMVHNRLLEERKTLKKYIKIVTFVEL